CSARVLVLSRIGQLPPFLFAVDSATDALYALSLHDALPIFGLGALGGDHGGQIGLGLSLQAHVQRGVDDDVAALEFVGRGQLPRSEEHTSELQSREKLVCRLLLEKKNEQGDGGDQVEQRVAH